MPKATNLPAYIKDNTLRIDASPRGGGIEIDASKYLRIPNARITAYQNYLGGGLLGAVCASRNFETKDRTKIKKTVRLEVALKKYFFNITNEGQDEWSEQSYEQNQRMPQSGF